MTDQHWRKAQGEKMTIAERELLFYSAVQVAHSFSKPTIVNIGVSWGASVHCLAAGAPKAHLIAIDPDLSTRPFQGKDKLDGIDIAFVESESQTYLEKNPAEPYHLVFVDGCHTFECVQQDIEIFAPHIAAGGLLIFHDYRPQPRDRNRLQGVKFAVDTWFISAREWQWKKAADSIASFVKVK